MKSGLTPNQIDAPLNAFNGNEVFHGVLVSGHLVKTQLDLSRGAQTLTVSVDVYVDAREAGAYGFDWTILNGDSYSDTEELSGAGAEAAAQGAKAFSLSAPWTARPPASTVANAALNKIFAQALKDAALVLERPDVLPKLGWSQP